MGGLFFSVHIYFFINILLAGCYTSLCPPPWMNGLGEGVCTSPFSQMPINWACIFLSFTVANPMTKRALGTETKASTIHLDFLNGIHWKKRKTGSLHVCTYTYIHTYVYMYSYKNQSLFNDEVPFLGWSWVVVFTCCCSCWCYSAARAARSTLSNSRSSTSSRTSTWRCSTGNAS